MSLAFNGGKSKKGSLTKKAKCTKTLPDNGNNTNITKENATGRKKDSKLKTTRNSKNIVLNWPSSTQNLIERTSDQTFKEKNVKGQKSSLEILRQTTDSCDKMAGSTRRSLRNRKASSSNTTKQANSFKNKSQDRDSDSVADYTLCEGISKKSTNTLLCKLVSNNQSETDLQVNKGDILRIIDESNSQCGNLMASSKNTAVDFKEAMSTPLNFHTRRTSKRSLSNAGSVRDISMNDQCLTVIHSPTIGSKRIDVGPLYVKNISQLMDQPKSDCDDDVILISETISKPKMVKKRFKEQQFSMKKKHFCVSSSACNSTYRKHLLQSRDELKKQMDYLERELTYTLRPSTVDFPDPNFAPNIVNTSPISISDNEDDQDVSYDYQTVDKDLNLNKTRIKCLSSSSDKKEEGPKNSTREGKRIAGSSSLEFKQDLSKRMSPSMASSDFEFRVDKAESEKPVIIDGSNSTDVKFSNLEDATDHDTNILIQQIDDYTNSSDQTNTSSTSKCLVTVGTHILSEPGSLTNLQKIGENSYLLPRSKDVKKKNILKDDFDPNPTSKKSCSTLKKCVKTSNVDSLKINASIKVNDTYINNLTPDSVNSSADNISCRIKSRRRSSTKRESLVTSKLPPDKNNPLKESINENVCSLCTSVKRGRRKNITCPHGNVESKTIAKISPEEIKIKLENLKEKSKDDDLDVLQLTAILLNENIKVKKCFRRGKDIKLECDSSPAKHTGRRKTSNVIESHGDDTKTTTESNISLNSIDKEHLLVRNIRTSMRLRSIKKETESCVEKSELKDSTCRKLLFNNDVTNSDSFCTVSASKLCSNNTILNKNEELDNVPENSQIIIVEHVDIDKETSVTFLVPDLDRKQDKEGKSKKKEISDTSENFYLKSKECTDQDTLLKVSSITTMNSFNLEDVEVREMISTPKNTTAKHPSYKLDFEIENNEKSEADYRNTMTSTPYINSQEGNTGNSNLDEEARGSSGGNEGGSIQKLEKERFSFAEDDENNITDLNNTASAELEKMSINKSKPKITQNKKDSAMFNSSKSTVDLEKNEPLNELSDQTIDAETHKGDKVKSDLASEKRKLNKDKHDVETEMESNRINCDSKNESSTIKKRFSNDTNENLISCGKNCQQDQSSSKKINKSISQNQQEEYKNCSPKVLADMKNNTFVSEEGEDKIPEIDCDSKVPEKKSKMEDAEPAKRSGKYKKERRVSPSDAPKQTPDSEKPVLENKSTSEMEEISKHSYEDKSTRKIYSRHEKISKKKTVSQNLSKEMSEDNNKKKEGPEKVKSNKTYSRTENSKSPSKEPKKSVFEENTIKNESERCTSTKKNAYSSKVKDSRQEGVKSPKEVKTQNPLKNPKILLPEGNEKKDERGKVKSTQKNLSPFKCIDSAQENLKSTKEVGAQTPTKDQKKKSVPEDPKKKAEHERSKRELEMHSPLKVTIKLSEDTKKKHELKEKFINTKVDSTPVMWKDSAQDKLKHPKEVETQTPSKLEKDKKKNSVPEEDKNKAEHERDTSSKKDSSPSNRDRKYSERELKNHSNNEVQKMTGQKSKRKISLSEYLMTKEVNSRSEVRSSESNKIAEELKTDKDKRSDSKERKSTIKLEEFEESYFKNMCNKGKNKLFSCPSQNRTSIENSTNLAHNSDNNSKNLDIALCGSKRKLNSPVETDPPCNKKPLRRPSLDREYNRISSTIENSIDNVMHNVKLQMSDFVEVTLDSFSLECSNKPVIEDAKIESLFSTPSNNNYEMKNINQIKSSVEVNKNETLDSNNCLAIPDNSNSIHSLNEKHIKANSSQDHVPFIDEESPVSPPKFSCETGTTIKEQIGNQNQNKLINSVAVETDKKITSEDIKHSTSWSQPQAEASVKETPMVIPSITSLHEMESSNFNYDDGISLASREDLSDFNSSNQNESLEVPKKHLVTSPYKRSSASLEEKIGFKMKEIVIEGIKMFKYCPSLWKFSEKPLLNESNKDRSVFNSSKDEASLDGEATLLKMVGFHTDKPMECNGNSQDENMKKETDLVKFFKPYCGDLLKYNMCGKNNCLYSHQFDASILSKTDFLEVWNQIEKLLNKSEEYLVPDEVFEAVTDWLGSQGKRNKLLEPGLYLASLSPEKVSSQYLSRCWSALMAAYRLTGVDKVSAAQNILQHLASHSPPYPVKMLQDIVYFIGLLEYDIPDVWPVVRVLRNVPDFQFSSSFFECLMINTIKIKRSLTSELQHIFEEFTNAFLLLDFDILKGVHYDVIDNFSEYLMTYKVHYFDLRLQSLLRNIKKEKQNEHSNVTLSTEKLDSLTNSNSNQVFVAAQVNSEKCIKPKTITTEEIHPQASGSLMNSPYNRKHTDMSTESDTSTFGSQSNDFCIVPKTLRIPPVKAESRKDFLKSGYASDSSVSSEASTNINKSNYLISTPKNIEDRNSKGRENTPQTSKNFNETFRGLRRSRNNSYSESHKSFKNKSPRRFRKSEGERTRTPSLDRSTYINPWQSNELPQIEERINPWEPYASPFPTQPVINYQQFSFHSAANMSSCEQSSNYFQTSCNVETNKMFKQSHEREYGYQNQAWNFRGRNEGRGFYKDNRFKKEEENKLLEENIRHKEAPSQDVSPNDITLSVDHRNIKFSQYPESGQFRKQHFGNCSQSELDGPQEASADMLRKKYSKNQNMDSFFGPSEDLLHVISYKSQNPSLTTLQKDVTQDQNLKRCSDSSKIPPQKVSTFKIFPKISVPRVSQFKKEYLSGDNTSSDLDSSDSSSVQPPSKTWSETYNQRKSKMLSLPFPRGTSDSALEDKNKYSICETKSLNRTPSANISTTNIYKTHLTGRVESFNSFKNPNKPVISNQDGSIKASGTPKMNINIPPQKLNEIRQSIVLLLEEKRLTEIFQVVCDWSENIQVMESLAFSILGAFKSIDNNFIYLNIREFFAILFKYQQENPNTPRNHNLHCLFGTVATLSMMELIKHGFWKNAHDIYSLLLTTGYTETIDERFTGGDQNYSQVCIAIAICEVLMNNKRYEQAVNIISDNKLLLDRDQWVLIGNEDDVDIVRQISHLLLETMCENSADENLITNFMMQVIESQKSLRSPINVMRGIQEIIAAYHDSFPDKNNLWLKKFYEYLKIHDNLMDLSDFSLRILLINFIRLRSRKADEIFSMCIYRKLYPEFNLFGNYIPIYSSWQKEEMWFILDKWFEAIAQNLKEGGVYGNSEFIIRYEMVDVSKEENKKRPKRLLHIEQGLEEVHSRFIQALVGCNPPLIYECFDYQNKTVKLHKKQCHMIIAKKLKK